MSAPPPNPPMPAGGSALPPNPPMPAGGPPLPPNPPMPAGGSALPPNPPMPAGGSALPPPQPAAKPSLNGLFAKLEADKSGFLSLMLVFVVGMVLSYLLWTPFAEPAKLINDALPDKNCVNEVPGTSGMRSCAVGVGVFKMIGPLCLGVLVFVLRGRLTKLVAGIGKKLHPGARPLIAPLLATLLFLLIWAGSHSATGGQSGILPQKAFPAVVGVYTFAVVRYSPSLQRKMIRFFTKRDRIPMIARVAITVAVPTAISLLITNQDRVSDTAQKEQLVLIIGLLLAYLMLSPKGASPVGAPTTTTIAVPPRPVPPS